MIYFELFLSFLQIGLFSIGGGYAALPLIQSQIVDAHGWLSLKEFVDVISIAEMTPGPIAINSATFVGIKIAGPGGAIVSTLGCILPSCVIVLFLAFLYHRYKKLNAVQGVLCGLRPAVVAIIASAGLTILLMTLFGSGSISIDNIDLQSLLIIAVSMIVLRAYKPNPVFIIGGSGAAGLFFYMQQGLSGTMGVITCALLFIVILSIGSLRKTCRIRRQGIKHLNEPESSAQAPVR